MLEKSLSSTVYDISTNLREMFRYRTKTPEFFIMEGNTPAQISGLTIGISHYLTPHLVDKLRYSGLVPGFWVKTGLD